ncbi:MAG: bifunctional phosphoribosylaminoimidazolecarboxamide formyltransferase/IMP cyclohydrolase [Francisellaceae bacterium]|nr:bifunctional phosphoribosylaminoimidazolecarboxamide formyltransferase/IMP cyclohydrolase [Francisellaceae bacterium]MBT6207280.1 bifunctional phosphoribosylaminoimidazolecarboxamide formyltransferase/IMP cyclohydrolase [Francisellaceae bacterium]MBT6538138.1 bifunctional phosphoribosylaminoimidazolecarboxamide formyltransferase/IMP cyclohydrolase [Francisellaceae bacterium]
MSKAALVSVSNKTGLLPLLKSLKTSGYTIFSTGGTAKFCTEHEIEVIQVQDYSGVTEMLDGRVKTLNHKIFAGILHKDNLAHIQEITKHDIASIDIVVVNCYPFQDVIQDVNTSYDDAIENIDIGGPSLIRAAAKNHARVTVLTQDCDYHNVIQYLDAGEDIPLTTRKKLATTAFQLTAKYDQCIYNYLTDNISSLRYGENPNQNATLIKNNDISISQYNGKPLSYNNYLDADCALSCISEFSEPACIIVKHAAPCGVAIGTSTQTAYQNAFSTDPTSAFGGVIAFNCSVDADTATTIIENQFFEMVLAPTFTNAALECFRTKKNARIIDYNLTQIQNFKQHTSTRSCLFGILEQSSQPKLSDAQLTVVSNKQPSKSEISNLIFAWKVSKYVKSNAIVYVKNNCTIGIGNGQTSRIASSEIGILKAQQGGFSTTGAVMASDGFFPFADNITTAANAGITAIIQPGGSIKDKDVIETANQYNLVLIHTGTRQFRH